MKINNPISLFFKLTVLVIGVLTIPLIKSQMQEQISQEEILRQLNSTETTIQELQNQGISVDYMSDVLTEAKRVYEQAYYASILRSNSSSEDQLNQASNMLQLIDWNNISYNSVLPYIEKIQQRKELALILLDKIKVEEYKKNDLNKDILFSPGEDNSSFSNNNLDKIKIAFSEERYEETSQLLKDEMVFQEEQRANFLSKQGFIRETKNIFQRYSHVIVISLMIFTIVGYTSGKKIKKIKLKKKLNDLKIEKGILIKLLKNTQEERYAQNKVSELVFNIRIKKYGEKLNIINEEILAIEKIR